VSQKDISKASKEDFLLHPVFMHAAIVNAFNGFCHTNEKGIFFSATKKQNQDE
jgi:hypothetical protein